MKETISTFEQANVGAIKSLKDHLAKVRTGRANVSQLDGVMVDYYGTPTPIKQVANLSTPDARTIQVQAWESGILASVEKAIIGANLGLTPMNDGKLIRVPVPPLTEERRKDLVKQCKKMGEDAKIAIRNNRRDANEGLKKLEKDKAMSEDEGKRAQEEVQKKTDVSIAEVDKILVEKEKEILTI
ncbi:MAG: ribosome recycling factor [Proteobacteria bacterium]|jgi:ribosome recycling factor|nr:MAG: ribosome recycling factor [Pseudomonadota bacterium]